MTRAIERIRAGLTALRDCTSGVALVELAVSLPFFLGFAMYGTEVARMAIIRMQVSQLAISVADNASRLGQTDNSGVQPTINESDINSVMIGAMQQARSIDLQSNGRIILSSLEVSPLNGRQWFHWQRCQGALDTSRSIYGDENLRSGMLATWRIRGVGPNAQLTALPGSAVMVAEVFYNFRGIFGSTFVQPQVFRQEAAFLVRDDRSLNPPGGLPVSPDATKAACPLI